MIGPAVVGVAMVFALVTADLGPGDLERPPDRDTPWITWLDDHPGGAVVALPPAPGHDEEDFEATTAAMVQSLEHGHPLVNGYSGFFPDRDEGLRARLERFPDAGAGHRAPRPAACLRGRRSGLVDRPAGRRARSLGLRVLSVGLAPASSSTCEPLTVDIIRP